MSKIVKAHMNIALEQRFDIGGTDVATQIEGPLAKQDETQETDDSIPTVVTTAAVSSPHNKIDIPIRSTVSVSAASVYVRNSLPHILPGVLLRYVFWQLVMYCFHIMCSMWQLTLECPLQYW
jgi:hypothetical protein